MMLYKKNELFWIILQNGSSVKTVGWQKWFLTKNTEPVPLTEAPELLFFSISDSEKQRLH